MAEPESNPMRERTIEEYQPAPRANPAHAEGTFTRIVEEQTARIPSSVFLILALGAIVASATFELLDRPRLSQFVGMWPPTLMTAGVYNKIVKTAGSA